MPGLDAERGVVERGGQVVGHGKAAERKCEPGPVNHSSSREFRPRWNPAPRLDRLVGTTHRLLGNPQQEIHFIPAAIDSGKGRKMERAFA